jgi:hypothetical protein
VHSLGVCIDLGNRLHHRPSTMLKHLDAILVAVQLPVARRRKFAICISTSPGEAANLPAQSPRQILDNRSAFPTYNSPSTLCG